MRHIAKRILAGALVLAAAAPAWAQDDEGDTESLYPQDSDSAQDKAARVVGTEGIKSIRIFGGIGLTGVYRGGMFDELFHRRGILPPPAPPNSPGGGQFTSGRDEAFINAVLTLGVEIHVNDALSGYFRFETGPADAFGAENSRIGDNGNVARFREGYATITSAALGIDKDDFDAWLRVGLQNVRLEHRRFPQGQGHPFMIDVMNSENPFTGTPGLSAAANGILGGTYYGTAFRRNTFAGGNAWLNNYAGQPKEQESGGVVFGTRLVRDLRNRLNVDIDLGVLTILETGVAQGDTEVAYVNVDISWGKPNRDRGLPSHHSKVSILGVGFSGNDAYVGSIGGGLDLFLADNLIEIFGEGQYQGGAYVNASRTTASDITRHESYGGYGGIRVQWPWHESKFYIEASGWFIMGDDGSPTRSNGRPATNRDFMSLENNNQTIIFEGSLAGLDLDSNYFAIKAELGFTLFNQLEVQIVGGLFQLIHEPNPTTHEWGTSVVPFITSAPATFEFDDNLGIEVDIRFTWRPSNVFSLYVAYGQVVGSDFLDEVFGTKTLMAGLVGAAVKF